MKILRVGLMALMLVLPAGLANASSNPNASPHTVTGTWTVDMIPVHGPITYTTLYLLQTRDQRFVGDIRLDGRLVALSGNMKGDDVTFTITGLRNPITCKGNLDASFAGMQGSYFHVTQFGKSGSWVAVKQR